MDESARIVECLLAAVQPVAGWASAMKDWHEPSFLLEDLNLIADPAAAPTVYARVSDLISFFGYAKKKNGTGRTVRMHSLAALEGAR